MHQVNYTIAKIFEELTDCNGDCRVINSKVAQYRPSAIQQITFNGNKMSPFSIATAALLLTVQATAFRPILNRAPRFQCSSLQMSDYASQVLAAQPTIEEWLDVAEPGLKKAVLAMFRSVKEISYKIRSSSFGTRVKRLMSHRL